MTRYRVAIIVGVLGAVGAVAAARWPRAEPQLTFSSGLTRSTNTVVMPLRDCAVVVTADVPAPPFKMKMQTDEICVCTWAKGTRAGQGRYMVGEMSCSVVYSARETM